MGAADKLVDPDVEAALSAIRRAISTDGNSAVNGRAASADTGWMNGAASTHPQREPASPRKSTSPEEIIHLRNKIAGHLDRLVPPATTAVNGLRKGLSGFAGILSGETRLQDSPGAVDHESVADNIAIAPANADDVQMKAAAVPVRPQPARPRVPEARWTEEMPTYLAARTPAPPMAVEEPGGMLSRDAAAAAQSAFGQLAETLMSRAVGERSVEEVTRELLRTMLKKWLDDNLPGIVERLVREEIERVARRGTVR